MIGLDPDGLIEVCNGAIHVALSKLGDAAIVQRDRIAGIGFQRFVKVCECSVQVSLAKPKTSSVVVRRCQSWVDRQSGFPVGKSLCSSRCIP
jgi:hypothetical protein